MKEQFIDRAFTGEKLIMIDTCNSIIENYQSQNLRLTLRQLYYQLVTKNIFKNEERSYKNLGTLLSNARLAGLVDWDAIEDRVRIPRRASEFTDIEALVEAALRSYRLPRWDGQNFYVELWVEKDAISGVLSPLANQYHVTLMVNRGYSSQSAMYEAAQRFKANDEDIENVLLYLGDLDPSGEDMVRDIDERLTLFGAEVTVKKIALNMEQVKQYNPPPNVAKRSDSRSAGYIDKFGGSSWEVDALPPEVLQNLVETSILQYVDLEMMDEVKEQEELDKAGLKEYAKKLKGEK